MMNRQERVDLVSSAFVEAYGREPTLWTRAPGRVDLMGSHTDYNMGYVMTMSIDRDTWLAAAPRDDGKVSIRSLNVQGGGTFDLGRIEHDPVSPWTDYVRGVAVALQDAGYELRGFDGLIHSTVPFGSGLSSSAAIEMATAAMFSVVGDFEIDPVQMALLGQQAENRFVGVNSGILDQYSSTMGRAGCALFLDCRDLKSHSVEIDADWQVVICDTRAERSLAGSEYDDRRAQCEAGAAILARHYPEVKALRDATLAQLEAHASEMSDVVARRCRFIIEENQRVLDLAEVLPSGDSVRLRALMLASYAGARDGYEISAQSMESMMSAMIGSPGVIGARQAGAGFGGCMVAIVDRESVSNFCRRAAAAYTTETGIEPAVYPVEAAPGAGMLAL